MPSVHHTPYRQPPSDRRRRCFSPAACSLHGSCLAPAHSLTKRQASPQSCLKLMLLIAPLTPAFCFLSSTLPATFCHLPRSPKPCHPPRPSPIAPRPSHVHPSPSLPRTDFPSTSSAPQAACKHAASVATGRTQPPLAGDAVATLALHHASSSASMPAAPASVGASARQSLHLLLLRR